MRVAFLSDAGNADGTIGGAELTMQEFVKAAPEEVKVVEVVNDFDRAVIGNCVGFSTDILDLLRGKRVCWYHNDLSIHIDPKLKAWLDTHADHIFCSPLQQERYGLDGHLIPPAIDLDRFTPTRQVKRNGERKGMVSVGAWQNPGKGQAALLEYAREHGGMDVYGPGAFKPIVPPLRDAGVLSYEEVPSALWKYERFVFLPWAIEPFGRSVVEAWAAGCSLVLNRLVGATYWIREKPEALRSAADDFWRVVLDG